MKSHVAFLFALTLLVGCSRGTAIRVTNDSTTVVSNVVVSGNGFTNQLGTIPPGATRKVTVQPRGESGVTLGFQSGGRAFDSGSREYVETGVDYQVTLTIKPDLTIVSGSGVRHVVDE